MVVTMSLDELTDARSRLVSGLKRYFRSKRFQGLLSVKVGTGCALVVCADAPYAELLHLYL